MGRPCPVGRARIRPAPATTPGAVVRKIEVFSSTGQSLGWAPVYTSIT
ncbi:hypothetical protein ACGFIW_25590 [Micromonospora sp. NPDC048935]